MQETTFATAPTDAPTPPDVPRWKYWLMFSPLARIAWFAAMTYIYFRGALRIAQVLGWVSLGATPLQQALANNLVVLVPVLIAYLGLVNWFERRPVTELTRKAPLLGLAGLAGGVGLFSAVVAVLWIAGSYHVTGTNTHVDWVAEVLLYGLCAGLAEEIVTRGVLFRICEQGLGTWFGLAISAAFFGAAHLQNPNATWWAAAAIAIEAGLLLAMLYHVTRSLWPCVGLHAGWNVAQGTLYGIPVSGNDTQGFLVSNRTGPDWLISGAFGAEASVIALGRCSIVTIALIVVALRRGSIVPPFWNRHRIAD